MTVLAIWVLMRTLYSGCCVRWMRIDTSSFPRENTSDAMRPQRRLHVPHVLRQAYGGFEEAMVDALGRHGGKVARGERAGGAAEAGH